MRRVQGLISIQYRTKNSSQENETRKSLVFMYLLGIKSKNVCSPEEDIYIKCLKNDFTNVD